MEPSTGGMISSVILAERDFAVAETAVFGCPYQHIAFTGGEEGLAFGIRFLIGYGVELGVVVYLKLDVGSGGRPAVLVHDGDRRFGGRGVVVDHVDLGVAVGYVHHLFRSVVFAEHFRMHQHTTVSRSVEPSQVEDRFRLAGAEEVPFAVYPGFHPSVVIVGMCPARRIDLARRYADRTEGGYRECRLFAATAVGCLHGCERRTCPGV